MCREDDAATLAGWTDQSCTRNVLCLTGPGGQGKSALAWAHFAERAVTGGVRVWHGFDDAPDPARAWTATLARAARQTYGCALDDDGAAAVFQQRIATEGALIVLDAIEHLYGPSARVLDALSTSGR